MLSEEILVRLGLDKSGFDKTLKGANDSVSKFSRGMQSIGLGISTALFGTMVKNTIGNAGALKDLSDQLGVSTDFLQQFQATVADAGGTVDGAANSLGYLARKLGDARMGNKEAARSFYDVGIGFQYTDGTARNLEDIIADIGKTMTATSDETKRAAISMEMFGKAGRDVINALTQGGLNSGESIISKDTIDALDAAGDKMGKMKRDATVWLSESMYALYMPIKAMFKGRDAVYKEMYALEDARKRKKTAEAEQIALNEQKKIEIGLNKEQEEQQKKKVELEKQVLEEKKKQAIEGEKVVLLAKKLADIYDAQAEAQSNLDADKLDRSKFTLSEIASGSFTRNMRVNRDIMAARQVTGLEQAAKFQAGIGNESLSQRMFNQADLIKSTISSLISNERNPWKASEENIAKLTEAAVKMAEDIEGFNSGKIRGAN